MKKKTFFAIFRSQILSFDSVQIVIEHPEKPFK